MVRTQAQNGFQPGLSRALARAASEGLETDTAKRES